MTEKRFYVAESNLIDGYCVFDREKKYAFHPRLREADCLNDAHTLNELYEEVMDLRRENTKFKLTVREIIEDMQKYVDDNQLVYINQSYVDWIKKEVDTTLYSQKELEE